MKYVVWLLALVGAVTVSFDLAAQQLSWPTWFDQTKACWEEMYLPTSVEFGQIEFMVVDDLARNAWTMEQNDSTCTFGSISCFRYPGHSRVILWDKYVGDEDTIKHEILHAFGAQHFDSVYAGYWIHPLCMEENI